MKISYNWLGELVTLTLNPKELAERLTMAGLAVEAVEPIGDDHILDFDLDFESARCAFASRHRSRSRARVRNVSHSADQSRSIEADERVESVDRRSRFSTLTSARDMPRELFGE